MTTTPETSTEDIADIVAAILARPDVQEVLLDEIGDSAYVTTAESVYIAGPMTGYEEFNYPLFNASAALLREEGFEVWNPAELQHNIDAEAKDFPEAGTPKHLQNLAQYMKLDLPYVIDADAIALLPGWQESRGSNIELLVAMTTGSEVWEFFDDGQGGLALAYSEAKPDLWLIVSAVEGR